MILEKIKADNLTARKAKDKFTSGILTCLIGEVAIVGKNDGNRETTDAEAIKVITKFKKGVNETIQLVNNRPEELLVLRNEIAIYDAYLPQLMDEDELHMKISKVINDLENPNMGSVMKTMKERYAGLYDGKMASGLIRAALN